MTAHDADYQAARKDWESFVVSLSEKISEVDSTIPELPAKDMVSPPDSKRMNGEHEKRGEGITKGIEKSEDDMDTKRAIY